VRQADFCRLIQKGAFITLVISGVTGPIFIVFAKNVANILPLIFKKSEWRYCKPFSNATLPNKRHPLRNQKRGPDRSYSNKSLSFGAKIAKIGRVDPEVICLLLKKKEITEGKIYSLVGKFAEQAKYGKQDGRTKH